MGRVLVDSNVFLDVMTEDPIWFEWSSKILERRAEGDIICINPAIYAEVSVRFQRIEEPEAALPGAFIERLSIPYEAAFLAGKCFVNYRRRGGRRLSALPDFFIGAHASLAGMPLITRHAGRYRTYFPKLRLIAPAYWKSRDASPDFCGDGIRSSRGVFRQNRRASPFWESRTKGNG